MLLVSGALPVVPRRTVDSEAASAFAKDGRQSDAEIGPKKTDGAPVGHDPLSWTNVIESIRGDSRTQEILHWAKQATPRHWELGKLVLAAPSEFVRDRILHGQMHALFELARRTDPNLKTIEVIVDPSLQVCAASTARRSTSEDLPWPTEFFSPASTRPRMRFERLVLNSSNTAAVRTAIHIAEAPDPRYRCIFIYGEVGTGKTHIRHSIASRFREAYPGRTVLSTSAEEFSAEYGRACRAKLGQAFRDRCSQIDFLVIDDLQLLAGRKGTQKQLLAMLDLLLESGRRVAVFSDRPLRALTDIHPRIITRLSGGPTTRLDRPNADIRFAILQDLSKHIGGIDTGIIWSDEALWYIADQASPDCRDLEGCILQIVSGVEPLQMEVKEVTLERARHILQERFLVLNRRLPVADIRKQVAKHFGLDDRALISKSRARDVVLARQVAMYVARRLTGYSLSAIGSEFGGRDHSTVSYAIQKVDTACDNDLAFDAEIRELIQGVESS